MTGGRAGGVDLAYDLLASDEWLEWNSSTWGLDPRRVDYTPNGAKSRLTGVVYVDRKGRIRMPPLNAYLPFSLECSGPPRPERVARQWLAAAGLFAADLARRSVIGKLALPPTLGDGRPFRWEGLVVEPRYTYVTSLPYRDELATRAVRQKVAKATRLGYRFESSDDMRGVVDCLEATGVRQGFDYRLRTKDLACMIAGLGSDRVRVHAVRGADGVVVSAGVRLVTPGGAALDWVQGTRREALTSGVAQLMYQGALADVASLGAVSFDFGGANIDAVARAKAEWGMGLTPYLSVNQYDARYAYSALRGLGRRLRWPARPHW